MALATIEVYTGTGSRKSNYDLQADTSGVKTKKELDMFSQQLLREVARVALKEEQAKGFTKNPVVRVDNQFGKKEEWVKPYGKIEYFAPLQASAVILGVYDEIEKRSIHETGTYKKSNWVFINGVKVAQSRTELMAYVNKVPITEKDKIRFVNLTPYARKLELAGYSKEVRGRSKGLTRRGGRTRLIKRLQVRAKIPSGAYALAEKAARRLFKGAATIGYRVIAGSEGGVGSVVPVPTPSGRSKAFRTTFAPNKKYRVGSAGRPYVYPSILLVFRKENMEKLTGKI